MIAIFALHALLASNFTFGKSLLSFMSPYLIVSSRMTIAGVLLLGYVWLRDRKQWRIEKQDVWLFVQAMFFHVALTYLLEYWGMQYVSSSVACLLFNLGPFITALFSYVLLHERITRTQFMGLCIGFLGFLPIIAFERGSASFCVVSWPELALIGAVATGCYGWILVQKLVSKRQYSPLMVNGVAKLGGGILVLALSFFIDGMPSITIPDISALSTIDIKVMEAFGAIKGAWVLVAFYLSMLIVNTSIIFYNFYAYLLRYYSATYLSFCGLTTPLFAALFGYLWLSEQLSWAFLVTIIMTSYGLYLFYRDELTQKKHGSS